MKIVNDDHATITVSDPGTGTIEDDSPEAAIGHAYAREGDPISPVPVDPIAASATHARITPSRRPVAQRASGTSSPTLSGVPNLPWIAPGDSGLEVIMAWYFRYDIVTEERYAQHNRIASALSMHSRHVTGSVACTRVGSVNP